MPTYDYQCQACDHSFEKFHSMTAASVRKCPECGLLKVKRQIGAGAAVLFKGSGFYETDYRAKRSGAEGAKASKPSPEGGKKD